MATRRCSAPCIITTLSATYLVLCEQDSGHSGDHLFQLKDKPYGSDKKISWAYADNAKEAFGPFELTGIRKLPADGKLPVCCKMEPGHGGEHIHTGTCDLLGAEWKIIW